MIPDERLEALLAEHAAAQECGLLRPAPTAAEAARFTAAEAAHVTAAEAARATVQPAAARASILRRRLAWWNLAVAAGILAAVGVWAARNSAVAPGPQLGGEGTLATVLGGRARIVPVRADTQYTITDSLHGKIRLDQGEVYVEVPTDEHLKVEIETPGGTATALGTRFYVHYGQSDRFSPTAMLAVAVLGGLVEVANSHGSTVGRAGEIVVADSDSAPQSQAELAPPPLLQEGDWRSFGRTFGLLHYPEVQAELKLTDEQKSRLLTHGPEEKAATCKLFKELQSCRHDQREARSVEFRDQLLAKLRDVLTPAQQWRFWQITLQQEGSMSLVRNEVADALELTAGQREQVVVVIDGYHEARQKLRDARDQLDRAEWNRQRGQLSEQANETLSLMLTDTQKQLWTKLVGSPFTLTRREGGPERE